VDAELIIIVIVIMMLMIIPIMVTLVGIITDASPVHPSQTA